MAAQKKYNFEVKYLLESWDLGEFADKFKSKC